MAMALFDDDTNYTLLTNQCNVTKWDSFKFSTTLIPTLHFIFNPSNNTWKIWDFDTRKKKGSQSHPGGIESLFHSTIVESKSLEWNAHSMTHSRSLLAHLHFSKSKLELTLTYLTSPLIWVWNNGEDYLTFHGLIMEHQRLDSCFSWKMT